MINEILVVDGSKLGISRVHTTYMYENDEVKILLLKEFFYWYSSRLVAMLMCYRRTCLLSGFTLFANHLASSLWPDS